jgi:anaerobic dimethyl sulfoxide reductase subunit A
MPVELSSSKNFTVPVSCNLDCGGACPLIAHVEDGKIVKITDNPLGGPYLSGCVKGLQMARVQYSAQAIGEDGSQGVG